MRLGYLFPIVALLASVAVGPFGAQGAKADANNPDVIPTFVDALNRGDAAATLQVSAPSLTLSLAGGQSLTISATSPIPASLLPITIVSLSPEGMGTQTVDGVFTFGSDPTQQRVQIKGEGGVIVSIRLLGP